MNFKSAQGLSDRTIDSYQRGLHKWVEYQGDVAVHKITSREIIAYLDWLRNEYVPQRFGNETEPLSQKTLRNIWVTLSAFFTWAPREFQIQNPMTNVPAPRFSVKPVEPFTQNEVQAMLKVCAYSKKPNQVTGEAL